MEGESEEAAQQERSRDGEATSGSEALRYNEIRAGLAHRPHEIKTKEAFDGGYEERPVFSRRPWRAASKLADAKKWPSDGRLLVTSG